MIDFQNMHIINIIDLEFLLAQNSILARSRQRISLRLLEGQGGGDHKA